MRSKKLVLHLKLSVNLPSGWKDFISAVSIGDTLEIQDKDEVKVKFTFLRLEEKKEDKK